MVTWEEATRAEEDWARLLTENPRVLWGIVADVVKAVKANEGGKKTGRRPAASVGSLDELYEVLFPTQYSEAAFPETFAQLLTAATLSQTTFATHSGISQATISRLLAGRSTPTVETLQRISHFLNVRPTYFREYRAQRLGQIITEVLLNHPALSAEAVKRLVVA